MPAIRKALLSLALLALGWTVGYAQRSEPQFTLLIDAPAGETTIECASGCALIGSRDLGNPNAGRMKKYGYGCSGRSFERCSASVAGWLAE